METSNAFLAAILAIISLEVLNGWLGFAVGLVSLVYLILKVIGEVQKQQDRKKGINQKSYD